MGADIHEFPITPGDAFARMTIDAVAAPRYVFPNTKRRIVFVITDDGGYEDTL